MQSRRTKQLDNKQLSLRDVGTIMFDVCDKALLMQQFLSRPRDKRSRRRRRPRWQTASRRATRLIDSRMTAPCTAMTASMTTREELTRYVNSEPLIEHCRKSNMFNLTSLKKLQKLDTQSKNNTGTSEARPLI